MSEDQFKDDKVYINNQEVGYLGEVIPYMTVYLKQKRKWVTLASAKEFVLAKRRKLAIKKFLARYSKEGVTWMSLEDCCFNSLRPIENPYVVNCTYTAPAPIEKMYIEVTME